MRPWRAVCFAILLVIKFGGNETTSTMATEAYVVLPEPRPIRRIVVRALDVVAMGLLVRKSERTGWKLRRVYDSLTRAPVKDGLSDLGPLDGVKVRIRRSLRDAVLGDEEAHRILGAAAVRAMRELVRGTECAWDRQGIVTTAKALEPATEEPVSPVVRRVHAPIYEIELLGPAAHMTEV